MQTVLEHEGAPLTIRTLQHPLVVFFFKQKTAYEVSACLVGSAMCIRDSASVVELGCIPRSCCLVDTSDAADDLLCVDLGGRRIIKKKN